MKKYKIVVKFKGELISWRNLSQLLHQHNITVPREQAVLNTVLREKDSSAQSCKGRCFVEERRQKKTCFCDKACERLSDCCLDFYLRLDLPLNVFIFVAIPSN